MIKMETKNKMKEDGRLKLKIVTLSALALISMHSLHAVSEYVPSCTYQGGVPAVLAPGSCSQFPDENGSESHIVSPVLTSQGSCGTAGHSGPFNCTAGPESVVRTRQYWRTVTDCSGTPDYSFPDGRVYYTQATIVGCEKISPSNPED